MAADACIVPANYDDDGSGDDDGGGGRGIVIMST